MNGSAFLLDTNAVIALLSGETNLQQEVEKAKWLGISIITVIEFNAFSALTVKDRLLFQTFSNKVEVVGLSFKNTTLLHEIYTLRRARLLKTPDAIIVASAKVANAVLLTRDQQLLNLGFDFVRSY